MLLRQKEKELATFDDLVDRYERRIFNLIYRLVGNYDEAADLTQDTFVAAFRSFDGFRAESSHYTWLYRIAVNVCKNRFRERDRPVEETLDEEDRSRDVFPAQETPEQALDREETRRMIEEAIAGLPEDYRLVEVLRDLHGLSYQEIAEVTGISVDVVRTRLARARAMLRRRIEPYLR